MKHGHANGYALVCQSNWQNNMRLLNTFGGSDCCIFQWRVVDELLDEKGEVFRELDTSN